MASAARPRRTIFRHLSNGDDHNVVGSGISLLPGNEPRPLSGPTNARAAAAGRSLLGRPGGAVAVCPAGSFTASAASTPLPPRASEPILRSCLSSSGSRSSSTSATPAGGSGNEEFELKRNVSFSHLRVREYEVTLGDNPSVSSGAPLSLGWRYDPRERIVSLDEEAKDGSSPNGGDVRDDDGGGNGGADGGGRATARSRWQLRLSDRERQMRIASDPDVSTEDLLGVLELVARTKFERNQTLNEAKEARKKSTCKRGAGRPSPPRSSPLLWIPSLFEFAVPP